VYKEKEMARAQPFTVELYPFVGVDGLDEIWNDLVCPLSFYASLVDTFIKQINGRRYGHYKLNEPSRDLPIGVFEAFLIARTCFDISLVFLRLVVLFERSLCRRRLLLGRRSS